MQRVFASLREFPSPGEWLEVLGLALLVGVIAVSIKPDLIALDARSAFSEIAMVALVAFFVPAFVEEFVFRGCLIPTFRWYWVVLSLAMYVGWHPVEVWLIFPEAAEVFLDPRFLCVVALVGIACTFSYWRTKSLWASILVHWLIVVGWKALGGMRFVV